MKKHTVVICTGTLCHVMGGSELPSLVDYLPEHYASRVTLKGSPCIEQCKNSGLKPPFAEIDGELVPEASIEKLVNELKKRIKNDPE